VSSNEFLIVAREVHPSDRDKFADAIKRGIEIRLGETELVDFIHLMALETMAFAWKYENNTSIEEIYSDYKKINSTSVVKLLDGIIVKNGGYSDDSKKESSTFEFFETTEEVVNGVSKPKVGKILKSIIYRALIEPLPYALKRLVIERAISLGIKLGMKHRWNFTWR